MPIYEYKCRKCNEEFEMYRSLRDSDDRVKCPKCGTEKPNRKISVFLPRNGGDCSTVRYG